MARSKVFAKTLKSPTKTTSNNYTRPYKGKGKKVIIAPKKRAKSIYYLAIFIALY